MDPICNKNHNTSKQGNERYKINDWNAGRFTC
jgi:hypothetical protein